MHDPQQLQGIIAAVLGFYAVMYVLTAIAFIVPTWFIAKKAGLSPWLSLLCVFPLTGLILFYILAFSSWKVAPVPQPVYESPVFPPQPPPQA
jgi:hypothetical protein